MPDACDRASTLSARDASRQLQMAQIVREELTGRRDAPVALISRAGLALQALGIGLTHAGLALRDASPGGWTVRQLYFACAEARQQIYDQGVAGFVLGTDRSDDSEISIVWIGEEDARRLAHAARDNARALSLVAGTYSANANPWGARHQNCNQWVAEMMALAWGPGGDPPDAGDAVLAEPPSSGDPEARARAQRWLAQAGYAPAAREVPAWAWPAAAFVRWIHLDDADPADRERGRIRTSLPEDLEAFVRRRDPGAERVRICRRGAEVVVQRGWRTGVHRPCTAGPGDRRVLLDD